MIFVIPIKFKISHSLITVKLNYWLNRFLKKHEPILNSKISTIFPILPTHLSVLYKSQKGSKDMYRLLNSAHVEFVGINRWNKDLNVNLDIHFCFKTVKDFYLIWVQYRILSRILGTRSYLCKIGITNNGTWQLCNSNSETILHIFQQC